MIRKIVGLHYSPMGGAAKITRLLTEEVADRLRECSISEIAVESLDLRTQRELPELDEETLVILGMPSHVGKIPLPGIKALNSVAGSGAPALLLVTYNSRSYGNSLYELTYFADQNGLSVLGAAAISVSYRSLKDIKAGKALGVDRDALIEYAGAASDKIKRLGGCEIEGLKIKPIPPEVKGKLPIHKISRISPRAAEMAQFALGRVPLDHKESEWFL